MSEQDAHTENDAATGSGRRPTRRERQRAATRERVYEAALDEFVAEGYEGAQIDRIAKNAGVVRGTFYFHFPTKADVLLEFQQRHERMLIEMIQGLSETRPPLREVFNAMVDVVSRIEAMEGGTELFRELLLLHARGAGAERLGEELPPVVEELQRHVREAAQRGELRDDRSPDQLCWIVLLGLFGVLLVGGGTSASDRRALRRAQVDVLVRGIERRPGATERH